MTKDWTKSMPGSWEPFINLLIIIVIVQGLFHGPVQNPDFVDTLENLNNYRIV